MWRDQLRAVGRRDFLNDVRYPVAFTLGLLDAVVLLVSYSFLFAGVLYPTSVLPAWLGMASALLPTTHALSAMRAAVISGASWSTLAPDLGALLGFDVIGIPVGLWLFTVAVTHAKRAGTLGHA